MVSLGSKEVENSEDEGGQDLGGFMCGEAGDRRSKGDARTEAPDLEGAGTFASKSSVMLHACLMETAVR
jgi:hypothetical protein